MLILFYTADLNFSYCLKINGLLEKKGTSVNIQGLSIMMNLHLIIHNFCNVFFFLNQS